MHMYANYLPVQVPLPTLPGISHRFKRVWCVGEEVCVSLSGNWVDDLVHQLCSCLVQLEEATVH